MARRRYRRDLIGHFIRKDQRTQQPCQHACCRGYRVHPSNYPVILPDRTLHRASDGDLATHFRQVSQGGSPQDARAMAQILHEVERRDRIEAEQRSRREAAEERRRLHREAVASGRAARQMEREAETGRLYLEAEEYTRGNWTNAADTRAGINDREILTGRQAVFDRYASEEAREFFREHARPTAAYFRGQDSRVTGRYTERRTPGAHAPWAGHLRACHPGRDQRTRAGPDGGPARSAARSHLPVNGP